MSYRPNVKPARAASNGPLYAHDIAPEDKVEVALLLCDICGKSDKEPQLNFEVRRENTKDFALSISRRTAHPDCYRRFLHDTNREW